MNDKDKFISRYDGEIAKKARNGCNVCASVPCMALVNLTQCAIKSHFYDIQYVEDRYSISILPASASYPLQRFMANFPHHKLHIL